MLFRIKHMVSLPLLKQLGDRQIDHMRHAFRNAMVAKISNFVNPKEVTTKNDRMQNIQCWEFEAHLIKTEDFDEMVGLLREINARTGHAQDGRMQKVMMLLAKDYDKTEEETKG